MSDTNAKAADKMSDMPVSGDKAGAVKGGGGKVKKPTPAPTTTILGDIKGESQEISH